MIVYWYTDVFFRWYATLNPFQFWILSVKKQVWYTILHMAWYTPKARRSKAFGKALYNAWGVTLFLGLTLPSNPTYLVFLLSEFRFWPTDYPRDQYSGRAL